MQDNLYIFGEYEMERSPEQIQDLRAENRSQNRRLERVEERVTELRVALVGIDDRNGLRGELRDHKEYTQKKLDHIESELDKIVPQIKKAIIATVGLIGTLVAIGGTLYRIFGG